MIRRALFLRSSTIVAALHPATQPEPAVIHQYGSLESSLRFRRQVNANIRPARWLSLATRPAGLANPPHERGSQGPTRKQLRICPPTAKTNAPPGRQTELELPPLRIGPWP